MPLVPRVLRAQLKALLGQLVLQVRKVTSVTPDQRVPLEVLARLGQQVPLVQTLRLQALQVQQVQQVLRDQQVPQVRQVLTLK